METSYQFTMSNNSYIAIEDGAVVAEVRCGAFLNHYGCILNVKGVAISYSVITADTRRDPTRIIRDLIETLQKTVPDIKVVVVGHINAQLVGASAFLKFGTTCVTGLWLHPTTGGVEALSNDERASSYYVDALHSGLVELDYKILVMDTINLRFAISRLVGDQSKA